MNSIWYDLNQIHRPSYSFTSVHICAHLTPSHHSNWLTYEKRSAYFHAIKKMERTTTEINSCLCLSASLFLKSKNVSIIRNGAISMKKLTHRPAKKNELPPKRPERRLTKSLRWLSDCVLCKNST